MLRPNPIGILVMRTNTMDSYHSSALAPDDMQ
ncbi:hypothetical protein BGLA2_220041 [Burkholderia gladioli]|nr:hypothetical protein BGLA2_220041 [Burkholderia gladioli]